MSNANPQDITHLHICQKHRGVTKFIGTINCDLFATLENTVIKNIYPSTTLDGDLEEAGTLALSPLKTGRRAVASELKCASQLVH